MLNSKNESPGPAVVLNVSLETIEDVFSKMRIAGKAMVTEPETGRPLAVLCREVGGTKTVLLLDPDNERATAEALNLNVFATRFKTVTLSSKSKP